MHCSYSHKGTHTLKHTRYTSLRSYWAIAASQASVLSCLAKQAVTQNGNGMEWTALMSLSSLAYLHLLMVATT